MAHALNLLAHARQALIGRPLRDAVAGLILATKLSARVAALPREFYEDTAPELDDLLALTSNAEAEGQTLHQFAETLRQNFYTVRETQPVQPDALQLLTCHKAKGLQWDAVILPFVFYRRQYPPRFSYPRFIHRGSELPAAVVFDGPDYSEIKEKVELRERREMERLLYVSMTRARHTLVLADDDQLFQRHGNINRRSLAGAMKSFSFEPHGQNSWRSFAGPDDNAWKALSAEVSATETWTARAWIGRPSQSRERLLQPLTKKARRNAMQFPRRILPSSFAGHRSDERCVSTVNRNGPNQRPETARLPMENGGMI